MIYTTFKSFLAFSILIFCFPSNGKILIFEHATSHNLVKMVNGSKLRAGFSNFFSANQQCQKFIDEKLGDSLNVHHAHSVGLYASLNDQDYLDQNVVGISYPFFDQNNVTGGKEYLECFEALLADIHLEYVNMSFGTREYTYGATNEVETLFHHGFIKLSRMFPQTFFFIAAGNKPVTIHGSNSFPQTLCNERLPNIVCVSSGIRVAKKTLFPNVFGDTIDIYLTISEDYFDQEGNFITETAQATSNATPFAMRIFDSLKRTCPNLGPSADKDHYLAQLKKHFLSIHFFKYNLDGKQYFESAKGKVFLDIEWITNPLLGLEQFGCGQNQFL